MKKVADLDINISDNDGTLRNLDEIIATMTKLHENFDTHAMSDYRIYREGQKDMLEEIISYLKRI
jgi:hypothetical protein